MVDGAHSECNAIKARTHCREGTWGGGGALAAVGARCGSHSVADPEGTFAQRAPGAPGIQMNAPAMYHNALPPKHHSLR